MERGPWKAGKSAGELRRFLDGMQQDDLVLVPHGNDVHLAKGIVKTDKTFQDNLRERLEKNAMDVLKNGNMNPKDFEYFLYDLFHAPLWCNWQKAERKRR